MITAALTGQGWGLAVAVGIGVLVGAERERHKGRGPGRGAAGVRTFALASLLGALAAELGSGALVAAVAFVGGAALLGYRRGDDPGLTTEMALVVSALLGALAVEDAELAAGVGVGVTLLLAERGRLHRLVRDTLSEQELHDALLLGAAALIVLPLVPDQGYAPLALATAVAPLAGLLVDAAPPFEVDKAIFETVHGLNWSPQLVDAGWSIRTTRTTSR